MTSAYSSASSALHAAHRVADGALEVELLPALARARSLGSQVADAGISALAHLACAALALTSGEGNSLEAAREGLGQAEAHLETLRTLLRACESQSLIGRMELMPLYYAIDETLAFVREATAAVAKTAERPNAA